MAIGLIHDPVFQEHDPGEYHPEAPVRLKVMEQALEAWPRLHFTKTLPLRAATEDELARVHTVGHITRLAHTHGRVVDLDPDTGTSERSYEVALLAAGSLIGLCDATLDGEVRHGMALVRPPGHHATPQRSMGFCLFNNVAIAARHLVDVRKLERVLIVDWDVHHGNGTEECFQRDGNVFYMSLHQSPMYPGTGPLGAMGSGPGQGYNLNVPLSAGQEDAAYLRIFMDLIAPLAKAFAPQFILVSAGFDAHRDDPLGGMELSEGAFAGMTAVLEQVAEEFCPGRIVMGLEGGYNPAAEARSVLTVLNTLAGDYTLGEACLEAARQTDTPLVAGKAYDMMSQYWPLPPRSF